MCVGVSGRGRGHGMKTCIWLFEMGSMSCPSASKGIQMAPHRGKRCPASKEPVASVAFDSESEGVAQRPPLHWPARDLRTYLRIEPW